MSKSPLSNAANHLRSLLEVFDRYVDADEARTLDRLTPILGDWPIDDIRSLVGFLTSRKFETISLGLTYRGYTLDHPGFDATQLVKQVLVAHKGDFIEQKTDFLSEFVRIVSSISGERFGGSDDPKTTFNVHQRLNYIRLIDFEDVEVPLGEFLSWLGCSDKARQIIFCDPSLLYPLLKSLPQGRILTETMESFSSLVQSLERLSNHTPDKQGV